MTRPGEPIDYDVLLQRCADRAYNFALRLCGNDQDAQDLVQEAFMKAFVKRDRYDPNRPFESWIFKILQNIYIDGKRRYESKHTVSLDGLTPTEDDGSWAQVIPGKDPDPLEFLAKNEDEERVQRALNQIPIHYRTAVVLFDLERMSYDEMSKMLDVPMGTVAFRIHQGRALLKKILKQMGEKRTVTSND